MTWIVPTGIVVFLVVLLFLAKPTKKCTTKSIRNHSTYLVGSMRRRCVDCEAEFIGDYFAAREGGGDVLNYYIMVRPGKNMEKK